MITPKVFARMQTGVHIKFVDSDDDMAAAPFAAAEPGAQPSAALNYSSTASPSSDTAALRCAFTIRADYEAAGTCYVFQLVHSPGAGLVAATLSNTITKLYGFK